MTATQLNEQFGIPGILAFDQHGELTRANITLPSCEATVYLQGAHLAHWQPSGHAPVLFLSERSAFQPGKAIRGGVPICFPWFGARSDGQPGPSHGFARTQPWELAFAALLPGPEGEAESTASLSLTFTLGPTDLSRSLGFDSFRVAFELLLGPTLTMRLTVANQGDKLLHFEGALHAYFRVDGVQKALIAGLEHAVYVDKRDENRLKITPDGPLQLTQFTDRVFPDNPSATAIHDLGNHRILHILKQNSGTTVVWNPWEDGASALPDLLSSEWQQFLALETANTASNAITLPPNQTHTMSATISVETA